MADRTQRDNTRAQDTNALNPNQSLDQPVNAGQGASEQKAQGAMMLAKPGDNKLNVFKDPSNRKDKFTYTTPLMIRVDYSDTKVYNKNTYVRVTEVPGQSGAYLGYALKSSIINTDVAYRALDAVGITEDVERGVFMANAHNESGGGNTMNESIAYSKLSGWRGVNGQAKGFAHAYEKKHGAEALQTAFSGWSQQVKANYMYGIEGRNQAKEMYSGIDAWMSRKGKSWTCELLGNTQADDGWRYRGRGAIQITGRSNFTDRNKELNEDVGNGLTWYEQVKGKPGRVDIVKNPELVGEDQFLGFLVSGLFWKNVCRRRIKNTANSNPGILKSGAQVNNTYQNGGSVLDLISDGAVAAKVGRMAVSGEYKNINNYAQGNDVLQKGLQHVTADYQASASAYRNAYETYRAEKGTASNGANAATQQTTTASQQTAQNESASSQTAENTEGSSQTTEFTEEEIAEKLEWYAKKDYHRDFIIAFQTLVGAEANGLVDRATILKVAEWQSAKKLKKIDGKFGNTSALTAGLVVKTNKPAESNQNQSGSQQNSGGKPNWAAALRYLNGGKGTFVDTKGQTRSYGHGAYKGMCATGAKILLKAAGFPYIRGNAFALMGPMQTHYGFSRIAEYKEGEQTDYSPQTGDVSITHPVGKHTIGHIAVYLENKWVSDTIQRSQWIYGDKETVTIFRY